VVQHSRMLFLFLHLLVLAAIVAGCVKSPATPVPTPIPVASVYFLYTKVSLNEAGTIKVEPPPNQNGGYKSGTTITLYAVVNRGFSFKQWVQGPAAENFGTQNPLTITITSNLAITAVFGKEEPIPTSVSPAKDDIRHFIVGDEPFQFIGAFVVDGEFTQTSADNLTATAKTAGLNVLSLTLPYAQNWGDEASLSQLDIFLDRASAHGIRVIVTFLHGLGIALDKTNRFHNTGGVEGLIRDENLKAAYKELIKRVVTRVNTVNGKKYSDDPTIMAWDLISEPIPSPVINTGQTDITMEELDAWVQEMVSYTKSLDPNHLVTMMLVGFARFKDWPVSIKELDFLFMDVGVYDILYVQDQSLEEDYLEKYMNYPIFSIGKPVVPQLAFTSAWLDEKFATDHELQGQIYEEALRKGFQRGIAGALIFSWGTKLSGKKLEGAREPLVDIYLRYDATDEEIVTPIMEVAAGLPVIDQSKSSSQFVRIAP